jgi:hypothetical protein
MLGGQAGMSSSVVTRSSSRGPMPALGGNIAKCAPTPAEIAALDRRRDEPRHQVEDLVPLFVAAMGAAD